MSQISKDDLKKLTNILKKADIETIATKTAFSVSYVRKVLYGTKYNMAILELASEIALLKKKEQDETVKKFKNKVDYIARK